MPANTLAVLLLYGCGLIHLVAGQCMEVQKGEEEAEEPTSDVWLPNRFHGKTSGFIFDFFSLENKLYAIKDLALNEEKT